MAQTTSQSNLELSVTDGFRYIEFSPPVPSGRLNGMPYPQTTLYDDSEHAWTPVSIHSDNGRTISMGWMMEAFQGGNDSFNSYAQKLAAHIGGAVLNPTD